MPEPWSYREIAVVLPIELARAMWRRAGQWDIERGGRFDRLGAAILIWSTNALASERGEPIGGVYVSWCDPDEDSATLCRVEWEPTVHGSESDVWRAIELLAGRALPPPA